MRHMKQFLILLTFLLFTGCFTNIEKLSHKIDEKHEQFYSSKKAQEINMKELIDEISQYKVIFVGDHHNNVSTHKFFTKVLENLAKKGYKLNLASEWFSPTHNNILEKYAKGEILSKELKEKRKWEKFTKYKWEIVEPLYETIKNSKGKIYGINLTKKQRSKISLKADLKMSKKEKLFYETLDLKVFAHKNLVKPYFSHCSKMKIKSSEPCEERMYRVQVAWDTYMAEQSNILARKVLKNENDKLIIFAGAMHIEEGLGIPLRFSRINNTAFTSISNYKISEDKDILIPINKADILYLYK